MSESMLNALPVCIREFKGQYSTESTETQRSQYPEHSYSQSLRQPHQNAQNAIPRLCLSSLSTYFCDADDI